MFLSRCRSLAKRTFWDPFCDIRRAALLFGCFFGSLGFSLTLLTSSYDLVDAGYAAMLRYFVPAMILPGLIYWPLLYWGFSVADSLKWRLGVLFFQLAALGLFFALPQDVLSRGIASGIVVAPFWSAYHVSMTHNTTGGNRSFEVAMAGVMTLLGVAAGNISSGLFLSESAAVSGIAVALAAMTLGTGLTLSAARFGENRTSADFAADARRFLRLNPYFFARIISQSLVEVPGMMGGALMKMLGFSPVLMASLLTGRIILGLLLAPLWGNFAHKQKKIGGWVAYALVASGWLLLLLDPQNVVVFFLFIFIISQGVSLGDTCLGAGLYEMGSYPSLMGMEISYAAGRAIYLFILLPLLFIDLRLYIACMAASVLFLLILDTRWKRSRGTLGTCEGAISG